MDAHINNLSKMCRVCTSRLQTDKEIKSKKIKLLAKDHTDHIYILYGIDISEDQISIHGQYLCYQCHKRIMNSLRAGFKGPNEDELNLEGIYGEQRSLMEGNNIWCEHSDNCEVCALYIEQCKPGRVKKSTKAGRPKQHTSTEEKSFNEHQFCKSLDLSITEPMCDSIEFVEEDQDHCICPICKDVLHKQAVNTGCHHFCALCLSRYYNTEKKHELPCPVCFNSIHINDVKPISDQFLLIINKARVKCTNCGISGRVNGMRCHICTSTPTKSSDQEPGTSAEIAVQTTPKHSHTPLNSSLQRSISSPLEKSVGRKGRVYISIDCQMY